MQVSNHVTCKSNIIAVCYSYRFRRKEILEILPRTEYDNITTYEYYAKEKNNRIPLQSTEEAFREREG